MAREGSNTLGIIGTGFQARSQLEACCMVRDIKTVKAWGRTREKLELFAEEMTAKIGIRVEPVATAREAVEGLGHRHHDDGRCAARARGHMGLTGHASQRDGIE